MNLSTRFWLSKTGNQAKWARRWRDRSTSMYDKDVDNAPTSVVGILIDGAEVVLKSFVDAILVKHGKTPNPGAPPQRHRKGHREIVITQIQRVEWELAPYSEATYDPVYQTLLIEKRGLEPSSQRNGEEHSYPV